MRQRSIRLLVASALLLFPLAAHAQQESNAAAQQNVPPAAQRAQDDIERTARRYRFGVQGGVGLDPEIIDVGAHVMFGPIFRPNVAFRPGVEVGAGEVTTLLAINLDVVYNFSETLGDEGWRPYIGVGPTFGLSHQGFEAEGDNVDNNTPTAPGTPPAVDSDRNRFDFSDTDFNGGVNFIVGMRKASGMFFEMKATAWGVSNIRLVAGFNF